MEITDLVRVVYSAGKVFDGLRTGRLDTEQFLATGSTKGVASRADLALLEDLRDAGQYLLDHQGRPVDARFVTGVNGSLTRSAALDPGRLRVDGDNIGVTTPLGVHRPAAITARGLQETISRAVRGGDPVDDAIGLFVALAKAQPFGDGNKRTGLFSANGLLLNKNVGSLLVVPFADDDPSLAARFNEALAEAYILDDHRRVKKMLHRHGVVEYGARR